MVLPFIDVLGGARSGTGSNSSGELCSDDDEEEHNDEDDGEMKIHVQDETQINNMALLHTIYFTIMYSLSFEECAHKMLQMSIKPGQEVVGLLCTQNFMHSYRSFEAFMDIVILQLKGLANKFKSSMSILMMERLAS